MIDNRSASHPQDLPGTFTVHGWTATTVDGRDHDRIERALRGHTPGRPHAVVAKLEGDR